MPQRAISCERAADDPQRRQEAGDPGRPRRARRRREALAAVAERLGAPDHQAAARQGRVADDNPYCTGGIGLLGTQAVAGSAGGVRHAADRRLALPLHRVLSQARPGARACRSTIDPKRIGLRYPVEAGLVGDANAVLRALLPQARPSARTARFLETAQSGMKEWNALMDERGTRDRQADEAAGRGARAQQAARRTTRSSRPTPARSPPGPRAISRSAAT